MLTELAQLNYWKDGLNKLQILCASKLQNKDVCGQSKPAHYAPCTGANEGVA